MSSPKLVNAIVIVLFAICWPRVSNAADLTLQWDPPSDGTATGYILYYGTGPGSYSQQVDVGNNSLTTVNGLSNGTTYYFAVRAYGASGAISDASNEIFAAIAPSVPPIVTALALQWDPPSDGTATGYILYYGTGPGSYSQQVDVGNNSLTTVNGLSNGTTYYFAVRAYDASGAISDASNEIFAAIAPSVPPIVTALALTANVASPQVVGATVSWLSTATGGVAPYQFQWTLVGGSTTVFPWATASTWSWKPVAPGTYQVRVAARSAGSSSTVGEMVQSVPFTVTAAQLTATLKSNVSAPQKVATTIRWSAVASGGTGKYEYLWLVFNGSVWTQMVPWTTNSTWSWTPKVPDNRYIVAVGVRRVGSPTGTPEAVAQVPFPITSQKWCGNYPCK